MANWIGAILAILIALGLFLLLGVFWLAGTVINVIRGMNNED